MRRAEIRTELADAGTVADAIRPDNTAEMDTRVEDGAIVTTIERGTTSGLRSTVDDYVVNLDVAARTTDSASRTDDSANRTDPHADRNDATTNEDTANGDNTRP